MGHRVLPISVDLILDRLHQACERPDVLVVDDPIPRDATIQGAWLGAGVLYFMLESPAWEGNDYQNTLHPMFELRSVDALQANGEGGAGRGQP
jgi:hypothetical protein